MPILRSSLLDLKSLDNVQIQNLFLLAKKIKTSSLDNFSNYKPCGETIGLMFFEPSTRTRMSFETAACRIGLNPILFDGSIKSSLEKGESVEDSILNMAAMKPRFLVVRCGDAVDLPALSGQIEPLIINAGWGTRGHPTQALLDVFTMQESLGDLGNKKVLFVGDIRHSRVVASHFELLSKLKVEIGMSAPREFLPESPSHHVFSELSEGLSWANVVIALRCQFERHAVISFSVEDYRQKYGLNRGRLKALSLKGLIMHPGPINHGIEMETEVLSDSRCRVLDQVTHGVYLREAILRSYLQGGL